MSNYIFSFCNECLMKPYCRYLTGELVIKQTMFCPAYDAWKVIYNMSNIPEKFKLVSFENTKGKDKLKDFYNFYVNKIVDRVNEGAGVFIYGSRTGSGKTHTGVLILNHYIMEQIRLLKGKCFILEYPLVMYVDYAWLIDYLRYEEESSEVDEFMYNVLNTNLLMLDDIGAGKMSDFAREQTNIIVNYRYNKNLPIIATSNYSFTELEKDDMLGKRAMSRLLDKSFIIECDGTGFRKQAMTFKVNYKGGPENV